MDITTTHEVEKEKYYRHLGPDGKLLLSHDDTWECRYCSDFRPDPKKFAFRKKGEIPKQIIRTQVVRSIVYVPILFNLPIWIVLTLIGAIGTLVFQVSRWLR